MSERQAANETFLEARSLFENCRRCSRRCRRLRCLLLPLQPRLHLMPYSYSRAYAYAYSDYTAHHAGFGYSGSLAAAACA